MKAQLALIALLLSPPGHAQEGARHLEPELLWKLGRVGAPELSPDGEWIVFPITRFDLARNRGNTDLWLLPARGGEPRRLTTWEGADHSPRWTPDGSRIGFLSDRSGASQLHLIDPQGGEAVQLTRVPGGIDNFDWAPRGERISFTASMRLDPRIVDLYPDLPLASAKIIDGLLFRHWNRWRDGTYSHLMVLPLEPGGAALDLMPGERVDTPLVPFGGRSQIAWAPDGEELCYTAKNVPEPARSTDSNLYLVPAAGGAARCITEGMPGFDREPLYSPDGRWIAFHSMARAGFEADRERLMLYERASGKIRELSARFEHPVGEMCWAPDSSGLYFLAGVHGTVQAWRIDLAGAVTALTKGRHDLANLTVSPDGKRLYACRSTILEPYELVAFPASGGEPQALTAINRDLLASLDQPTVGERWIETHDGKQMQMWVVYPPDFDPARKYPMLLYCQGGPQIMIGQWFSYRWNFRMMASRGYIVIAPNRRGLPGFGQEWNDAISGDWGGAAMQDYITAVEHMFGEPYVDREHTAAIGASFGGYSIYWLMGHDREDRFCAMVAHCGTFNLESMYGHTEELWFPDWDLGGPYWESAEAQRAYERNSPHRFVGSWDTPLLVVHSEKDFRVPISEGLQAFTAAQLRGVPSRFLYFPEEGHWVLGPQNGVLWHRVFFDWLDRWCKPD